MYDHGLITFLKANDVSVIEAVNKYLQYKKVTDFKPKHHDKVNNFIKQNWQNFASFVHNSIKSGSLIGKPIKLNSYYDEQKEYKANLIKEFEEEKINSEEKFLLNRIRKEYGSGFIQSFLMKKDIIPLAKDRSYLSKTLQWLPLVRQAIKEGINETNK